MNITQKQVVDVLSTVVDAGDDVFIHASLGALGHFDGGIDGLINAIRDATGPHGTVIMMSDTRSFAKTGRFSIDQPSETGLLTEKFRLTSGVRRSCVPMVSFCAVGARADHYLQPYNSHLDESATISRHLLNNGKILLMGVSYEKCTLYHLAEERCNVPYNMQKEFLGILIKDGLPFGPISQRYFVRRETTIRKDPFIAGRMLEDAGLVRVVPIGNSVIRAFRAPDFDACCMRALEKNPLAFLA
jgi:aminoglycoside N3'-acetyltransferase